MVNLWEKAKSLILQDVKNENEVKRTAVILRLNSIIMIIYFAATCFVAVWGRESLMVQSAVAGVVMYGILFRYTYYNRTKLAYLVGNVLLISWIGLLIYAYGNKVGELGFFYMLIVLLYVADYLDLRWKTLYVVFLLILRMLLFCYAQNHSGIYQIAGVRQLWQYAVNAGAICALLLVTVAISTADSREMEKKLVAYNKKLSKLARLDALTGLSNRRDMMEYVNRKAEEYESGTLSALSIAIGDIDFFKSINDTYGHLCGDKVLRKLAGNLADFMKSQGKVGRWGGEEFLFVFKNRNGDEAGFILSELQNMVRRLEFPVPDGTSFSLTMTFGLAEYDSRSGVNGTIDEADGKLYIGKERGRDTIIY